MSSPVVLLVLGGLLLVGGAELLVRGASRLALALGVTPLMVGLTVVAFGTSAPEMAVTVGSAYAGQADAQAWIDVTRPEGWTAADSEALRRHLRTVDPARPVAGG